MIDLLLSSSINNVYTSNHINILCIVIILAILIKSNITPNKIKRHSMFNKVVICSIILIICDIIRSNIEIYNNAESIISYLIYYIAFSITGYYFFTYFGSMIHCDIVKNKKYILSIHLPLAISIIFLIFGNIYAMIFSFYISYAVLAFVLLFIIWRNCATKNKCYLERIKFIIFPMIPLLSGILHIFFNIISIGIGISLSIILGYIVSIELLISIDALTNIDNRTKLLPYLEYSMRHIDKDLHLMMIDVNKFKEINDIYGHIEGDICLVYISDIIRQATNELSRRAFVCRYGGDEFVIVTDSPEAELNKLTSFIDYRLNDFDRGYLLTVTIGIATISSKDKLTPNEFIKLADNNMYKKKHKK